ncbi:nucleobase-ascorbate transporter 6-like [Vicia villosa]|uniref:nucleobase-ascorbate transporter 6-like n=1 Tax=Vicia villosa TaxID=3911 RepID=UPI00273BA452|nr:nucleobase-ascorbate transporter 6-like [Vicia villosa]
MSQQDSDYRSDGQKQSDVHEEEVPSSKTPLSSAYEEEVDAPTATPAATLSSHPVAKILPNKSYCGKANLVSGMIGTGSGVSTSIENAGLIGMTRVGSRRVIQISAAFMIFFSTFGKFGALFASIPASIYAALYCISFAYVGSGGLDLLQFCNLNSFRGKFIMGFSIFMGFSIPQYFVEYGPVRTRARWFNDVVSIPFSSGAFVAGLLAVFLDSVLLRRSDSRFHRDRGMQWLDRFTSMRGDSRSAEYYSLPF